MPRSYKKTRIKSRRAKLGRAANNNPDLVIKRKKNTGNLRLPATPNREELDKLSRGIQRVYRYFDIIKEDSFNFRKLFSHLEIEGY